MAGDAPISDLGLVPATVYGCGVAGIASDGLVTKARWRVDVNLYYGENACITVMLQVFVQFSHCFERQRRLSWDSLSSLLQQQSRMGWN